MRVLRSWLGLALPMVALVASVPLAAERSARQAQSAAPSAQSPTAEKLPSAREVINRHVKAIGGREMLMARSSSHATGTIEMPAAGLKGTLELFQAKPNSMLMRVSLPGVGDVQEGFNGKVGWSISPMTGPALLQGKQLEERRLDADFYADLQPEKRYESVTVVEKTTFEGRPAYKVRMVKKGGGEDFQFFDVESGLKVGSIATRESPMGAVTATTVETDYKPFGKLLTPTKLTLTTMGIQQVMTIQTVEYDNVDPSVFEPPAQIKALMK